MLNFTKKSKRTLFLSAKTLPIKLLYCFTVILQFSVFLSFLNSLTMSIVIYLFLFILIFTLGISTRAVFYNDMFLVNKKLTFFVKGKFLYYYNCLNKK